MKEPLSVVVAPGRVVIAKYPSHVWHCDLTMVPTSLGFWVPWLAWALPQRWPFCWWVTVVVDHFSRRVMGVGLFEGAPASAGVRSFLDRVIREAGTVLRYFITDQGRQFVAKAFRRWFRRRGIRQRSGAVGKYGSLAVVERFIRTLKDECTRRILAPYRRDAFQREASVLTGWYNGERPHETLIARTPDEIHFGRPPACLAPRFEPRRRWPRRSPCAAPQVPIRGRPGVRLELRVSYCARRRHLPIVELRAAA